MIAKIISVVLAEGGPHRANVLHGAPFRDTVRGHLKLVSTGTDYEELKVDPSSP
jgi:hypothetical protein